jgi:ABC-type multidrug transport system fused ATPase/permease subunit
MDGIRRPVVGSDAWRYVLIMVVSFATSVVATRVYLEATGYPQIGNATFHFAHALWGGLLQVVAALLLLMFINRWVYSLSAALAGIGIGLFVDEVGKFITQNNDYFFPLAAPIIYAFFLLLLLVYLIVNRRSTHDARAEMYRILQRLEEVLENDLSASERDLMLTRLQRIKEQTDRPDLAELASHLSTFLRSQTLTVVPDRESWTVRLIRRLNRIEARLFNRKSTRRILVAMYLLYGLSSVLMLVILVSLLTGTELAQTELLQIILNQADITSSTSLSWYLVMTLLHLLAGLLIFGGALAFLMQRDRMAIGLGVVSLIITLTFINTLSFYFNQFSVLVSSIYSFAALLALQRYRDRFLERKMGQLSVSSSS